jgi:hypothetical protein
MSAGMIAMNGLLFPALPLTLRAVLFYPVAEKSCMGIQ